MDILEKGVVEEKVYPVDVGPKQMLLLNNDGMGRLERVTLVLDSKEALELIEKLSYLLRRPEYHHNHLEDEESALDFLILHEHKLDTYGDGLKSQIESYLRRKGGRGV